MSQPTVAEHFVPQYQFTVELLRRVGQQVPQLRHVSETVAIASQDSLAFQISVGEDEPVVFQYFVTFAEELIKVYTPVADYTPPKDGLLDAYMESLAYNFSDDLAISLGLYPSADRELLAAMIKLRILPDQRENTTYMELLADDLAMYLWEMTYCSSDFAAAAQDRIE